MVQTLFQAGKESNYRGIENRTGENRPPTLSPEAQNLLNSMRNIFDKKFTSCRDSCVIPREAHTHIGHACSAIKEIGGDSYTNGINNAKNQHSEVKSFFDTLRLIKKTTIKVIVWSVIGGILGLIGYGVFLRKWGG
jgi:hypothetical protein